jgi:hypothetical protein
MIQMRTVATERKASQRHSVIQIAPALVAEVCAFRVTARSRRVTGHRTALTVGAIPGGANSVGPDSGYLDLFSMPMSLRRRSHS